MKSKIIAIGMTCLVASLARADFVPVALTPASYTYHIVVPSNAPLALPYELTATTGTGTSKGDTSFFEQGLYNRPGLSGGNQGIPIHNTTFTSINNSQVHFLMPPTYTTNNTLQVDSGHTSGGFTFATPTNATSLAILCTSGGGSSTLGYTVTHTDGSTDTGTLTIPDWFNGSSGNATVAWGANGRIDVNGNYNDQNYSSVNNNTPYIYSDTITVSGSVAISNINFTFSSGGEPNLYAVSGSTGGSYTPIPVSGFNQVATVAAYFPLTATMDQGTNISYNGNLATWYETNYVPNDSSGIPASGSIFSSHSQPTHHFQMGNYSSNDSILIDVNHKQTNIVPAVPTAYSAFAFLTAGGDVGTGNKMTNICIFQHQDGVSETNVFFGYDWFESTVPNAVAWYANGRVEMGNRTINNLDGTYPALFETYFLLTDTTSPVTNIVLKYGTAPAANATTFIMAVSATVGLPIIFNTNTLAQNIYAGQGALFNASLVGGTTPVFYWQKSGSTNGPWANLTDGATGSGSSISGSGTSNLVISTVGSSDVAYYRCIGTNSASSGLEATPPIPLTLLVNTGIDVVSSNDVPTEFGNPAGSTAGETVIEATDGTLAKWYTLGTSAGATPFVGPVGFVITPGIGNTTVTGIRLFVANDHPLRDPADVMLEGSADGVNFTTIYGDSPVTLSQIRNPATGPIIASNLIETEVDFANTTGYNTYRVTFDQNVDNVSGGNTNENALQIGEVQLLGTLSPIAPGIAVEPSPASKTIYVGGNLDLNVVANGPTPLYYQWFLGPNPISGATNASYPLSNVQVADSGSYSVTVSNAYGTTPSTSVTLNVVAVPSTPYVQTVFGDSPVAYWRLDEPETGGGDNGTAATDYVGSHDGVYTNVVLGVTGYSVNDSDTAASFDQLNTGISDVYNIQGINFAKPTNQDGAFSVEAWVNGNYQGGTQGTGYQQTNGVGIVTLGYGGGGEQFSLDCGGTSNGFRFYFRDAVGASFNAVSAVPSEDAKWHHLVGIVDEPNQKQYLWVDGQLASLVALGTNGLGILADNSPTNRFTIGWRNGSDTPPALADGLQFQGTIDEVSVYNYALSSNQVQNHYLSAGIAPTFLVLPTNQTNSQDTTATFTSLAYGTATLGYQWYTSDGVNPATLLGGQTGPNLVLNNVQSAQAVSYQVVVTNGYGAITSPAVSLTVVSGVPQIEVDLQPVYFVYDGTPLVLSVTAGGTPPLSYQWQFNSVNLTDNGRISGSQSNVLTISKTQTNDTGTYQLIVSNAFGTTPSTAAAVTVEPVLTFNGTGQDWSINRSGNSAAGNNGFQGSANTLQLTANVGNEASSSFFTIPEYVGGFIATFNYQDATTNGADGMAFVVQNDPRGAAALGVGGGSFGFAGGTGVGIAPSVGAELNLYGANSDTYAFQISPTAPGTFSTLFPVNIDSGDVINVTISYLPGTMTMTLVDNVASVSTTASFAVDIPSVLGTNVAYVGFTGGDGGVASTQLITDFTYVPIVSLSAAATGSGSLVFTWPTGIGAYTLEQSSSLNPANWVPATATITTVGGVNQATVSAAGAGLFYRLHLSY